MEHVLLQDVNWSLNILHTTQSINTF